ncbi:MAG: hypothetical protein QM690_04215 [Sphingobium sp.]
MMVPAEPERSMGLPGEDRNARPSRAMTMIGRFLLIAASLPLLPALSGCAAPAPVVQSSGTLPGEGGYGFGEGGAPPAPAAAAAALADRLKERGLAPSDSPRYVVQAEYSRPPAKTGTMPADQTPPQWRRAPAKGGRLSRFSLSVTEIASGTEVYRTAAWQRARGKADDSAALVQAALTPPPPPPPPAPGR